MSQCSEKQKFADPKYLRDGELNARGERRGGDKRSEAACGGFARRRGRDSNSWKGLLPSSV